MTPAATFCYITRVEDFCERILEGMPVSKIVIDEARCKGCALCTIACPHGLLRLSEKLTRQGFLPAAMPAESEEDCTSCALCARMCPDVAITVFRQGNAK